MNHNQIILMVVGEVVSLALFLYVLYLFGGMYQHVKKMSEKVEMLEKKLEKGS
jgi:cell division protein FtsB